MTVSFSLSQEGEAAWRRLLATYHLEQRRGVAAVVSARKEVRDECRHRLEAISPLVAIVDPKARCLSCTGHLKDLSNTLDAGKPEFRACLERIGPIPASENASTRQETPCEVIKKRLEKEDPALAWASPSSSCVLCIQVLAALYRSTTENSGTLPVVWLETGDQNLESAWREALSSLNFAREELARHGPVFVVLAGPPELLPQIALRAPDLWSVVRPTIDLGETLSQLPLSAKPVHWLHLSDLHLQAGLHWRENLALETLIHDLPGRLKDAAIQPQLVFVTGDLTWAGQREEFEAAAGFLDTLMECLELEPRKRLFIVPGNHDVNRTAIGRLVSRDETRLLSLEPDALREEIELILASPEDLRLYGSRLEAYCAFTQRVLGPARQVSPDRPWRTDRLELGGLELGIASLCSVWVGGRGVQRGKVLLGERQVREALSEIQDTQLRVVLLHHPPEWLHEGERRNIQALLSSNVHFVIHGPNHEEDAAAIRLLGPSTQSVAAAGGFIGYKRVRGFGLGRFDPIQSDLTYQYWTWSDHGRGLWEPVATSAPGEDNVGSTTHQLRISVPFVADDSAIQTKQRAFDEGLTERLRRAASAVYGQIRFIGLPNHAPKQNVRLTDLFVPTRFKLEDGPQVLPMKRPNDEESAGRLLEDIDNGFAVSLDMLLQWLIPRESQTPSGSDHPSNAKRVLVVGDPGSGKTTLTRYLAIHAANLPEGPVPLLVPGREYLLKPGQEDLLEFASREARDRLAVPAGPQDLEALCDAGRALLLVDGLDEVHNPGDRDRILCNISGFANHFPRIPILVTSRAAGYDRKTLGLPGLHHLRMEPFNDTQLEAFVTTWYQVAEPDDPVERTRRRTDLLGALEREPRAKELARTPLLATLVALVHRYEARLPCERAKLYETVSRLLLETWPIQRGHRFPDLDEGRQREVLERLALSIHESHGGSLGGAMVWIARQVTIKRKELEEALANLLAEREPPDASEIHRRELACRWIDYLAEETGLLVEQQPGVYAFLHFSLMDYLAGRALLCRELAKGEQNLAETIAKLHRHPVWRETLLLLMGGESTRGSLIDVVVERLLGEAPETISPGTAATRDSSAHDDAWDTYLFLLGLLREEVDIRGEQRYRILSGVAQMAPGTSPGDREEARRLLSDIARFSRRHGSAAQAWLDRVGGLKASDQPSTTRT